MSNSFFSDDEMKDINKAANKMLWRQFRSMWPWFLMALCGIVTIVGSAIWLLLYILETYVGKA